MINLATLTGLIIFGVTGQSHSQKLLPSLSDVVKKENAVELDVDVTNLSEREKRADGDGHFLNLGSPGANDPYWYHPQNAKQAEALYSKNTPKEAKDYAWIPKVASDQPPPNMPAASGLYPTRPPKG